MLEGDAGQELLRGTYSDLDSDSGSDYGDDGVLDLIAPPADAPAANGSEGSASPSSET